MKRLYVILILLLLLCSSLFVYQRLYWRYQKAAVVQAILNHKFPAATTVATNVSIDQGITSNWCWITAYITFQTAEPFSRVEDWYMVHPEGITRDEGGSGLDLLEQKDQLILYGVRYQKSIGTFVCPVGM